MNEKFTHFAESKQCDERYSQDWAPWNINSPSVNVPYQSKSHKILVWGEMDFSLSYSLLDTMAGKKNVSSIRMVATTYDNQQTDKYPVPKQRWNTYDKSNTRHNIQEMHLMLDHWNQKMHSNNNVLHILYDVDATNIEQNRNICRKYNNHKKFDYIFFGFPQNCDQPKKVILNRLFMKKVFDTGLHVIDEKNGKLIFFFTISRKKASQHDEWNLKQYYEKNWSLTFANQVSKFELEKYLTKYNPCVTEGFAVKGYKIGIYCFQLKQQYTQQQQQEKQQETIKTNTKGNTLDIFSEFQTLGQPFNNLAKLNLNCPDSCDNDIKSANQNGMLNIIVKPFAYESKIMNEKYGSQWYNNKLALDMIRDCLINGTKRNTSNRGDTETWKISHDRWVIRIKKSVKYSQTNQMIIDIYVHSIDINNNDDDDNDNVEIQFGHNVQKQFVSCFGVTNSNSNTMKQFCISAINNGQIHPNKRNVNKSSAIYQGYRVSLRNVVRDQNGGELVYAKITGIQKV